MTGPDPSACSEFYVHPNQDGSVSLMFDRRLVDDSEDLLGHVALDLPAAIAIRLSGALAAAAADAGPWGVA